MNQPARYTAEFNANLEKVNPVAQLFTGFCAGLLEILHQCEAVLPSQLAGKLGHDRHCDGRCWTRLERLGYVKRSADHPTAARLSYASRRRLLKGDKDLRSSRP